VQQGLENAAGNVSSREKDPDNCASVDAQVCAGHSNYIFSK